jgi:hypothetical protein
MTAIVSEQARVSVPASVTLLVNDVTLSTDSPATALQLSGIVLPASDSELRILIKAAAPSFAPPASGGTTWAASDVRWNATSWANGTSAPGRLTYDGFTAVAVCAADAGSCGTNDLVFTLAPKTTVSSGAHTLTLIWKFEIVSP